MKFLPIDHLRGTVVTPGDKSISHRAVMIASLSDGRSTVRGMSAGADVVATMSIMKQMGAIIESDGEVSIVGPRGGLRQATHVLDCGNSGTTIRLLMGLLAGVRGEHVLDGDESLRRRPMNRVAYPLEMMGLRFSENTQDLYAPFRMFTNTTPNGIEYKVPVPSAQVKSAVLLAGLSASSPTTVIEETKTRANTEEMLLAAGITIEVTETDSQRIIRLEPGRPEPQQWNVPQDPSQAAFFVVAAAVHPDAELRFENVYGAPERNGYLEVLRRMGANIDIESENSLLRMTVRSSVLRGTTIHSREIPSVDEVPILVVAASAASGTTDFLEMSELRLKESDRFANSISLARALGASVEISGDSFSVTGLGSSRNFKEPYGSHPGDHRMTMATVIAGICGAGGEIEFPESTQSSFPGFFDLLTSLSS